VPVPAEDDEFYRDVPTLVTAAEIREAMDAISLEMQAASSEVVLVEGPNGWRLATHPRFARWVRLLRNEPPPVRLSPSSLETLAVIAYRQPATRAEIEQIRGVSAEAGITKLLERELIYIVGRADLPGRPIQYGTTEAFLEFVGIKSLDELPSLSEIRDIDDLDPQLSLGPPADAPSQDSGRHDLDNDPATLAEAVEPMLEIVDSSDTPEPDADERPLPAASSEAGLPPPNRSASATDAETTEQDA